MNDSIFHAQTLQTEVFRSAWRLVEIENILCTGYQQAMISSISISDCLP